MLLMGTVGAVLIAVVVILAIFLQPEMEDPDHAPLERQSAPAAPAGQPPLN